MLASLDIAAKPYPAAERALETVLAKRPNDAVALNNLAWVLQLRGVERARSMAQRAYTLAPSPESADTLGWVMTARGDAQGAVALLRQASQAPVVTSTASATAPSSAARRQRDRSSRGDRVPAGESGEPAMDTGAASTVARGGSPDIGGDSPGANGGSPGSRGGSSGSSM